jgi:hypothetical protein
MPAFVLFCKSYAGDLRRIQRLWSSVQRFNRDQIPFYISVPEADRNLFENTLGTPDGLFWVSDEDIVRANPRADLIHYRTWDGRLSQQVVKSEFWRYSGCDGYLCMDSESEFIRDFRRCDFLDTQGRPYTVIHQAKEMMQLAVNRGIERVPEAFHRDSAMLKEVFGRKGPDYDFGPTPVIWSARVWQDLDEHYLKPRGETLWDAILERPGELRWYGEALLHYKSIPLLPIEPLFRVYHYDWQFQAQRRMGERIEKLQGEYMGVLSQSNWEYQWDFGSKQKPVLSRMVRWLKYRLAR